MGRNPPLSFKLEVPSPGPAGLEQPRPAPAALERPWLSWRGTVIPAPEKSASREERVKPPEWGTLKYEGHGREKPRNEELRSEKSRIKEQRHQEPCENPPEKSLEQPRAKVEQQTMKSQRRYIRGLYANCPPTLPLTSQKTFAACTKSDRGTDVGSGMSGGADHTSVPNPAGTKGPENDPVSMGMLNVDNLGRGFDDGERSTGTNKARSGARDHDGKRG